MLKCILEDFEVFVPLLQIISHQFRPIVNQPKHLQMLPLALENAQALQSSFPTYFLLSMGS